MAPEPQERSSAAPKEGTPALTVKRRLTRYLGSAFEFFAVSLLSYFVLFSLFGLLYSVPEFTTGSAEYRISSFFAVFIVATIHMPLNIVFSVPFALLAPLFCKPADPPWRFRLALATLGTSVTVCLVAVGVLVGSSHSGIGVGGVMEFFKDNLFLIVCGMSSTVGSVLYFRKYQQLCVAPSQPHQFPPA